MGLVRARPTAETEERYSLDDIYEVFTNGNTTFLPNYTWSADGKERVGPGFVSYAARGYANNGVIFSVLNARLRLFCEATFKFRKFNNGRPGDLFGNASLSILETPWPNGTTGDLLARMEQDASLAGNFYARRLPDRLERLRPDWVEIVTSGTTEDVFGRPGPTDLLGYIYYPGGIENGDGIFLDVGEVAHWAPIPDPLSFYRGMSWMTPIVRELDGDTAMSKHKNKFFEMAATPNMLIKFEQKLAPEAYDRLEERLKERYVGTDNAYRTMILEGGADATVIGKDFQQMDFSSVQAAGENRIAAAGGVPAIIVGLKEGLAAATYSNFQQAQRSFANGFMRSQWRSACGALAPIVNVPSGTQLWYDDRDIAALREDASDLADVQTKQAAAIRQLIDAGYTADSVVAAVTSDDWTLLKHSGYYSVQLWLPGQAGTMGEGASAKEPAAQLPPGAESAKAPSGNVPVPANGMSQNSVLATLTNVRQFTKESGSLRLSELLDTVMEQVAEDQAAAQEADMLEALREIVRELTEASTRSSEQTAASLTELAVAVTALAEREQPAPVVNVAPPNVTLEPQITVEQPNITIEAPSGTKRFVRDRKGNIVAVEED